MNTETLNKFKKLFQEQKDRLVYSKKILDEDFHLNKDDMMDEVDLTSSHMAQSMKIRLRNRETLYLKKIDEALARIADGTFGECGDCGDEIEVRRLEARPTTTLCIQCKEDQERSEKSHIDSSRSKSMGRPLQVRLA